MMNKLLTWVLLAVFVLLFIVVVVGGFLVIVLGMKALIFWLAGL